MLRNSSVNINIGYPKLTAVIQEETIWLPAK